MVLPWPPTNHNGQFINNIHTKQPSANYPHPTPLHNQNQEIDTFHSHLLFFNSTLLNILCTLVPLSSLDWNSKIDWTILLFLFRKFVNRQTWHMFCQAMIWNFFHFKTSSRRWYKLSDIIKSPEAAVRN